MALLKSTYGKARVRVMRIHRDGARHEVRELTIQAMLKGDFSRAYTARRQFELAVATDTIKNIVNIVARENLALDNEPFCVAVAQQFFKEYPQVDIGHDQRPGDQVGPARDRRRAARPQLRARQQRQESAQGSRPRGRTISIASGARRLHVHEVHGFGLGSTT